MSPTLTQQLTAHFYYWEVRGRGWQVWECPVEIEPAFEPFYFHYYNPEPVIDDAKKPTLLSSIADKLTGSNSQALTKTENSYHEEEFNHPEPYIFTDTSEIAEITISLPPDQKVSTDIVEHFLLNLTHCTLPLSFEIIGSADSIIVQMTCRTTDLFQLKQQLQAHFPGAVFNEEKDFLINLWNKDKDVLFVDFGLSQEFMRPLKIFRSLDPDPLIGIIGALENLRAGEIGLIQILFQAVRNPWSQSIARAVTDGEGKSFFQDAPEMIHLAAEKISKPLFACVIRVASQASYHNRALEIVRAVSSGLTVFSNPKSNELIPLNNDGYDDLYHQDDLLFRRTCRSGMILNSDELLSIMHPPSTSIKSPKLVRELKKTKPVPSIATGHNLVLGINTHQGKETKVSLNTEQRIRHTYLIGATGSGKSTLLLNLIAQDIKNGLGLAVLDPHGDLIDKVLGYIPEERFEDVILLDPADSDYPIGLNILSAHSELEKNVLSSDLAAVFKRLSTSWGDQMTSVLGNAILAILESRDGGTLVDLRRFLVEKSFRESFLKTIADPEVVYYWQNEFPLLSGKPQASVLTRLDTFLRPKLIRNMVAQKDGLNFENILNSKKIFLCKLAQGLIGEENSYLLGTLIVSKLHQIAMSRQARSEKDRDNFFLYIDEFQNFITPSMASILSGARKYHLGLILAHQELRQLWNRDTELANSVISNPGTRICFRLGDFDAQKLSNGFSSFDEKDLQNLSVGEAIVRIERAEFDFNLKTFPAHEIDDSKAEERKTKLIALSREKYAKRREEIEKILIENSRAQDTKSPQPVYSEAKEIRVKPVVSLALADIISNEELSLLKFLSENPGIFVTKAYQILNLSGYKGDKFKENLIEKGLIVQEETRDGKGGRLAKVLNITEKGTRSIESSPLAGKGGDYHKYLQSAVKEQAEVFGWKAKIEEKIKGSIETVDVGLIKDDIKIAVEISSTTKPEQEVQNIRKCLEAGYDYIFCIAEDEEKLVKIKSSSRKHFNARERERIRFVLPSQVKNLLSSAGSMGVNIETKIVSEKIPKQKQLMGTEEAAEFLGISKNTLYEWVIQRKVPFIKVGRLTKFKKVALEEWLENNSHEINRKDYID
ncbi:MAG: excisionase family DNA-binding protein [Candidatus Schekmanbacteria bacterium]|nr:excisionase family DNA-binding protein [Candidatus Schekmanbacteria bacterium]